jgi:PAS domain S-box-containing protein
MNNVSARLELLRKRLATYLNIIRTTLPIRSSLGWRKQLALFHSSAYRQTAWRMIWPLLAFAAAYIMAWSYLFVSAFLGAHPPPAPLFPPEAVLITALLLTPPRRWWIYLVAAFLIQVPILAYLHLPLWWNLLGFTPDAIEPVVAVGLMRLFIPVPPRFASQREVSVYTASVIIAVLLAATVGSAVNAIGGEPYWTSWRTWVLSDTLANLVLAPNLILWISVGFAGLRAGSRRRYAEAMLLYGGLLVLGLLAYNSRFQDDGTAHALLYLPVPLLLWAAVRFGPRGIASALALITILAIPAVANALGPFASQSVPAPSTLGNVFILQMFLLVIGVPLFFLAALVEDRKQTEAALQSSELRFRAAFESAATGMMLVDLNGHILQTNHPATEMLGYSEPELRTHTFMDFTYPDDLPPNLDLLRRARAGEIDSYQLEKRFRHKAGHLLWGRVSAGVVRDAQNRPCYLVGQLEDITERKRLGQELAEQAEQLDRIFEGIGEGVLVYDAEGRVVRVNAAARRLLGLDTVPIDLLQIPIDARLALYTPRSGQESQLLTPSNRLAARALRGDVLGEVESQDIRMRTLDERELEVSASVAPLRDPAGQTVGAVLILSDRTERNRLAREREEALASEQTVRVVNEWLDTFLAIAAHDLRSPVAVVKLETQMAKRRLLQAAGQAQSDDSQRLQLFTQMGKGLEKAERNLDRLSRLIGQLLDVSRVRSGKLVLDRKPCLLAGVVGACVEEQRLLNPTRTITLNLCESGEADTRQLVVSADADRLCQVLTNYLTNAVRYSPGDKPIEVSLRLVGKGAETENSLECPPADAMEHMADVMGCGMARVEVRDHGPGIPPEEQETIWGRFQRARSVMEVSGLGLGLYISQTIVDMHGGHVGVESIVGQGSTFWFTVPTIPGGGDVEIRPVVEG